MNVRNCRVEGGHARRSSAPRVLRVDAAHYPDDMSTVSSESRAIREALMARRDIVDEILDRYGATNLRLFGSVARGEASDRSDLDLLVDLSPGGGNELLRVSGIAEEMSQLLDRRVDVVTPALLRDEVSATALADAVAV